MSTESSSRGKICLDFAIWLAHQILTWRGDMFYQVLMTLWMSYSVSRYPIWLKLLSFPYSSSQILVIHIEQWYNCSIVHGRSIQRFIPHALPLIRSYVHRSITLQSIQSCWLPGGPCSLVAIIKVTICFMLSIVVSDQDVNVVLAVILNLGQCPW